MPPSLKLPPAIPTLSVVESILKNVIELTRGYNNREIVDRVELDFPETWEDKSQVLTKAFALVRSPENAADGFRVFNDQGRLRVSAWLGTRDDDSR